MNVEERLREAMRGPGYALPGWPDATTRIRAGIAARRRRRAGATALALATVAVVTVPAFVFAAGPGRPPVPRPGSSATAARTAAPTTAPTPGQVIPWLERPAPAATPSSESSPVPCEGPVLSAAASAGPAGAADASRTVVTLTNLGDVACALPKAELSSAGTAITTRLDESLGVKAALAVEPGEAVQLQITMSTNCGGTPAIYSDVWLWSKIPVTGLTLRASCPVLLSPWYAPDAADPSDLAALTALRAYLDVPSSVGRSDDLVYVVTLANPTDRSIDLSNCPVFDQRLGSDGGRFLLNCPFNVLPPGSWVR
jgi:hypothetical protein